MRIFIVFIFFLNIAMAQQIDSGRPFKICPNTKERLWNVTPINSRQELNISCELTNKMIVLRDFIPFGSKCNIFEDHIICEKNKQRIKICIGPSTPVEWNIHYDLNYKCPRASFIKLKNLIPEGYLCMTMGQGIRCLPQQFNIDLVFPTENKKKIIIGDHLKCPENSWGLGDIDRVICFYNNQLDTCEHPRFYAEYNKQKVCLEINGYFYHIWNYKDK